MPDVIGIGSPVKDLLVCVENMPPRDGAAMAKGVSSQGGGKVASAMVASARQGTSCGMYANLGDDAKGRFCKEDFERHGIDVSHVKLMPGKTSPFCLDLVEISSQTRSFIGLMDQDIAPQIKPDELDYEYLRTARLIHLERGNDTARAAATFARENGILTAMDADSYSPEMAQMEPLIDLFIASAFYMKGCYPDQTPEEAVQKIAEKGCKVAIITLGSKGLVGCVDHKVFRVPVCTGLKVIDTTGAGDVFHGGFISAYLNGLDPEACARYASAVSYIKCTRLGGRAGIPSREQVEHFLRTGALIGEEELDARAAFYRDLVM